ncbi:MAG: ATP-binding protein [Ruminiclostridium sp.]|nr:ATP-binding protein [Ruminiclostridium sp.]
MSFEDRFYRRAEQELNRIRQKNAVLANMRDAEIRRKYPDTYKIKAMISGTSARLLSIIADKSPDIGRKLADLEQENLSLQSQLRDSLVSHGYPADYLQPIYDCRLCLDTGIANGRRCTCFMNEVKKAASEEINKSSPLKLCRFEDFSLSYYDDAVETPLGATARGIMEYNLETCREYADGFHLPYNGLLMRGKTGLGKTHLSLSIASVVIEKGYNVIYCSAPDIFRTIEREHFGRAETDTDTLAMVIRSDLLVLDDLGSELDSKSGFYAHTLYNILNDRLNASLPTVISTNLDHKQLEARYEERTYSRISTMNELIFMGSDVRVKRAALQNN